MNYYLKQKTKPQSKLSKIFSQLLLSIIFFLISLIVLKSNDSFKEKYQNLLFNDSYSYTKLYNLYQKYFGEVIPVDTVTTTTVSNETLTYLSKENYYDGYQFTLTESYPIPALNSGIIVYLGDKDNYGNTCIIEGIDGVDIWYGNINISNLTLYDYVKEGNILSASLDNKLNIVLTKDGNYLKYEDYLSL